MAIRLDLPALGQSMEEGTITRWFKVVGDHVTKGEALYEVMTDKVNIEVECPETGFLRKIMAAADETIAVNGPVAIIGTVDEDITSLETGSVMSAPVSNHQTSSGGNGNTDKLNTTIKPLDFQDTKVFASPRARRYADEYGVDINLLAGKGTGVEGRIVEADVIGFYTECQTAEKSQRVSPLAQRVASVHGVPVTELTGSGYGGKVVQEDVHKLISPSPISVSEPLSKISADSAKVIKLTGMRKMVADAVARSAREAPHVTITIGVDMSEAAKFRQQVLPAIEKSHGVRVTFTDIVAKATARALADHPLLNSTIQADLITQYDRVNMGIAVSLGADGLIVPVVNDVGTKSLGDFSKELKALVVKARSGSLAASEVTCGTFSITNLGTYGITQFNPIINPPQSAILGVCTITDTVVPISGQAVIRPIMNLCLSFDHRVADGAPASAFLARVKEILEQPYLMFA